MRRVPGSYLGCASGLAVNQNRPRRGLENLDGVLFGIHHVPRAFGNNPPQKAIRHREISDGLSNTLLVGEAVHDSAAQSHIGQSPEDEDGDHKDHWYIGSDDVDTSPYVDASEALGSTGVRINLHNVYSCGTESSTYDECMALQLSFSSNHPNTVNVVMCDASVTTISENIEPRVWSDMGTRAGQKELQ